tara:strand:- start:141 stop:848 length:708 start_codon:yes stop_codon:yes gene_type:complete
MAYQSIGIGTTADDGTGDSLRIGADKINDNFVEIYTALGNGTALSSGVSASASVITLGSPVINTPTIAGVVGGTQTSATITTLTNTTLNSTTVNAGTATVAAGSITDSSGAIDFGNENLTTTGTLASGAITTSANLTINASAIVFEGASADAHETTVTVTDPTADRTITIPNITGTVVTTGDTNSVTGTMIAADTVAEANMANDAIGSAELKTLSTLLIKNSSGSTLKTLHGAGA